MPLLHVRQIFEHLLERSDDVRMTDGQAVTYPLEDDNVVVCDFGLLSITSTLEPSCIEVRALGELVMTLTPDDFKVRKPGPWIGVLIGIRQMLDGKYGPQARQSGPMH